MDDLKIEKNVVKPLFETKFLNLYDLQYKDGVHYYDASRRKINDIFAIKTEEEFQEAYADAVSCFLIIKTPQKEPLLLLFYEYRYPIGRYVLGVPAGLIDEADKQEKEPLFAAMKREIFEETGIRVQSTDRIEKLNSLLFCTPGMTDESNAFILCVVDLEDLSSLTQKGAEGGEKFSGFLLLDKKQAKEILKAGKDPRGHFYPMVSWCAMTYFVSDLWKEE